MKKKGDGYTITFRLKERELELLAGAETFECYDKKPYAYYWIIGAVVEHIGLIISNGGYYQAKELLKLLKYSRGVDTSLVEALLDRLKEKMAQEEAIKKALIGGE